MRRPRVPLFRKILGSAKVARVANVRRPRDLARARSAPGRVPTTDDLLAVLRADWPRVRAGPDFVDRVLLGVRRVAAAGGGPRRSRSRVLVGAAGAFLLAFVAGVVEAGRGGVRAPADTGVPPPAAGPATTAADRPPAAHGSPAVEDRAKPPPVAPQARETPPSPAPGRPPP
jgi:hypothetical protein